MAGWPGKITRAVLGPLYENAAKITNPKKQLDAAILNPLMWQVAGMNGTAARGLVKCTIATGVITVTHQWFAWDPDQALPKMEFVYAGIGDYTWTLPGSGSYADANGTVVAANLLAAVPFVQGTANRTAIGSVNLDGISGTMKGFAADTGGVADIGTFLVFFF